MEMRPISNRPLFTRCRDQHTDRETESRNDYYPSRKAKEGGEEDRINNGIREQSETKGQSVNERTVDSRDDGQICLSYCVR